MVKNKIEQKIESNDKIGIAKEKAKQIRILNLPVLLMENVYH